MTLEQELAHDLISMPHNKFFLKHASHGVADNEASEFKTLNDRFGMPGNPNATAGPDHVGVWVLYPINNQLLLELSVIKNAQSKALSFKARLCTKSELVICDYGNRQITMDIPLSELQSIVSHGVSPNVVALFLNAAHDINWQPIGVYGESVADPVLLKWP